MKNINIEELKKLINKGLKLDEISNELSVSVSTVKRLMSKHDLKSLSLEIKKKNKSRKSTCEECGKIFSFVESKRERKFCSKNCCLNSNQKILQLKRVEVNEKIADKLRKGQKNGNCLSCKLEFEKKNPKQKCCSDSCSRREIANRPETKKRTSEFFSNLTKQRHDNGDESIGWKSRKKLQPSYPEKLTIDYLNSKKIEFEYELKCGKYFIDFAFQKQKIALEIDGRRHDDLEIKEKDKRKDNFLSQSGWIVFRLKWFNDNKHYERLNSFIVQFGLE